MSDYPSVDTLLEQLAELWAEVLADEEEFIDEAYESIADDMIDEVCSIGDVTGIFCYDDAKTLIKKIVGILEDDIDIKLIDLSDPELNEYDDPYFIDLIETDDDAIELWVEPVYFEDGRIKNYQALTVFAFDEDLKDEIVEANMYEEAEYITYILDDLDEE